MIVNTQFVEGREWVSRIDRADFLHLGKCLIAPAIPCEVPKERLAPLDVVGVSVDGVAELPLGGLPIPAISPLQKSERAMRLGERSVEFQGLVDGFAAVSVG